MLFPTHCDEQVLSPYVMFGCLSALKFYNTLSDVYKRHQNHSKPPVSLHGQVWSEAMSSGSYILLIIPSPEPGILITLHRCFLFSYYGGSSSIYLGARSQTL